MMMQFLAAAALVTAVLASGGGASAEEPQRLSLKEAIRGAAERNLDVRAALYNPAMAEAEVRKALGQYDYHVAAGISYGRDPSFSPLNGRFGWGDSVRYSLGAYRLLQTGGIVTLAWNNAFIDSPSPAVRAGNSLYNFHQSDVGLSLSQPLLKNFGRDATETAIEVARTAKGASQEQFRSRLTDIVLKTRTEYFRLYTLEEDLEVKKTSLRLAQKILDETKARVRAGVLPAMEILNAEYGVSQREKDVIDSDRAVRDQQDVLRSLLQTPTMNLATTEKPADAKRELREDEGVRLALETRPELAEQRAALRAAELLAKLAKNRTLPDLSLEANGGFYGASGRYGSQIKQIATTQHPQWSVGLKIDYPLGNEVAENDYLKAKLKARQLETQLRVQEDAIANEVRSAVRGVNATWKQLEVADRGRSFAEERLRSFIKKNEVGLATTKDVLDVENDLAAAKSAQIKARTAYDNALAQYWKSTGQLLQEEGITIKDDDVTALLK